MMIKEATTLKQLQQEVRLLRSVFIGIAGSDEEGHYRSNFVEDVLAAVNEKPTETFQTPAAFLAALKRV